jgi:plasmid stability protein
MPSLLIPDIADNALIRLRERATIHGRSLEAEAKVILEEILRMPSSPIWDQVNALRAHLAASDRTFDDSTELIREDRER